MFVCSCALLAKYVYCFYVGSSIYFRVVCVAVSIVIVSHFLFVVHLLFFRMAFSEVSAVTRILISNIESNGIDALSLTLSLWLNQAYTHSMWRDKERVDFPYAFFSFSPFSTYAFFFRSVVL